MLTVHGLGMRSFAMRGWRVNVRDEDRFEEGLQGFPKTPQAQQAHREV